MSYTRKHEFDEGVVDRIKHHMRMNDISIKALAEKAGLTYNQLYQVLKKNQLIKLDDYVKICKALAVEFDQFLEEKEV